MRRTLGHGYRVDEVNLKPLGSIKEGTTFTKVRLPDPALRAPVLTSLGPIWPRQVLPHPDQSHPPSTIDGIKMRSARLPPTPKRAMLRLMRRVTDKFCKRYLVPLAADTDTSFETWIANTPYPEWRKQQLREVHNKTEGLLRPWDTVCKVFVKDEVYPEYKYPRLISARKDESKVYFGPIFKLIEEQVFALPWFIKKIPMCDRPALIRDTVGNIVGAKIAATDHTAFESSFTREVMANCEWRLYSYMTKNLPDGKQFMHHVRTVLGGVNKLVYKWFVVRLVATRQSGEMNTSLGNGFSNLMIMFTLARKLGFEFVGFVEGDDGLFAIKGPIPTMQDFADLGFVVKMEIHDSVNTASFCGNIFDMEELTIVTDPLKTLANLGWTSGKYASAGEKRLKTLLRAKALSLAYQYPACPILSAAARYCLRMTKSYEGAWDVLKDQALNYWDKANLLNQMKAPPCFRPPGESTRLLVERLYGIPSDVQLAVELYFDSKNDLGPIDPPLPEIFLNRSWQDYADKYTVTYELEDNYRYPPHLPRTLTRPGFVR